jgi:hypothetical protein
MTWRRYVACRVHRGRIRLVWRGTSRIARRGDGSPFDGGSGWGPERGVDAWRAADAINRNIGGWGR